MTREHDTDLLEEALREMEAPFPPKGFEEAVAKRIEAVGVPSSSPSSGYPHWRDRLGWVLAALGGVGAAALSIFSALGGRGGVMLGDVNIGSFLISERMTALLDPALWSGDAVALGFAGMTCVAGMLLLVASPKRV